MSILTFDKNNFFVDGTPLRIIAGDIHYFRIHQDRWEKILDLAVDFGLNTIQTYVPWNAHESVRGQFDFSGMLDLAEYLSLCKKKGLKVLLRPSPYICSEWDLGGLPAWLLKDRDIVLRSSDPKYLKAVEEYYSHLIPIFLPFLSTNGGPIIAVGVENEYGSYGNDRNYLLALADMLRRGGVDVPLYTTDGASEQMLIFGRFDDDSFFGVNYRAIPGISVRAEKNARRFALDKPFFVGELWSGRSMHWGEPFYHRDPTETSKAFLEALELGGHICFYMFAGGTNFGFMGGANMGRSYSARPDTPIRYIPHTTSYDVDALISEDGTPTEKYFLCRDALDEHLGKKKRSREIVSPERQAFAVSLTESAALFNNIDALSETKDYSMIPKPMEEYGQNYGLILYSTTLDALKHQSTPISLDVYRDRANIYIDNDWFATFTRDRGIPKTADGVEISSDLPVLSTSMNTRKIDILVENIGRINFGNDMIYERKGLENAILSFGAKLFGYEINTLPLKDLTRLTWKKNESANHAPCFFKGTFAAKHGIDTFVDFSNFGHGYIWINGFNLGRYDSAGPQMTLYVPGPLLKDLNNEIIILDIDPIGQKQHIQFIDHAILEGEAKELS